MDRIVLATGNRHKYREMREEFDELEVDLVSPFELEFELRRPESGENYLENARIKADEAHDKTGLPSLADDSGLEVEALDGAPGIHSSRWAGTDADAADRNRLLLDKLTDLPPDERAARYVCEMVLVDSDGQLFHTRGICEGRISTEPRGDCGFGYDPIFEVKEADWKTFGELPARVKKWLSHRALALNKMVSLIRKQITGERS